MLQRFPHSLEPGEVDHGRDWLAGRSGGKSLVQIDSVADVTLHHRESTAGVGPGQLQQAPEALRGAVGKVVEHHQAVANLQQHQGSVAANEAGAAGD